MIFNMGGGTIPKQTYYETTITPGTEDQIIPEGTFLKGDLTILGDPDLKAKNIVKDVEIFGVVGTQVVDFHGIIEREVDAEGYPIDVLFKLDHAMNFPSSLDFRTHYERMEKIEIVCDTLLANHFAYVSGASNDNKKIKIKCKTVNNNALKNAFNRSGGDAKMWLSDVCVTIDKASSWGNAPFTYSPATTMYCESPAKKDGWGSMWNYKYNGSAMTTYYGITEEAFDAL